MDFLKILKKLSALFLYLGLGLGILITLGCKEDSKNTRPTYPYFAALKASKINARCGPGMSYPIEWIFVKADIPVQVLEEYEHWRKIKDFNGDEAWINKTMLKKKRTGLVQSKILSLYSKPDIKSNLLAHLETGVLVEIKSCDGSWCLIKAQDFKGFVQGNGLFGVRPGEQF